MTSNRSQNKPENKPDQNKKLLTINEVAELFGVHPETLRRWDNEGKLKAIRIGKRGHRKYLYEDIQKKLTPLNNFREAP